MIDRHEYYAVPRPPPHIYYQWGWWRVRKHPLSWRDRNATDRDRWEKAYAHLINLNNDPVYMAMRDNYYNSAEYRKRRIMGIPDTTRVCPNE